MAQAAHPPALVGMTVPELEQLMAARGEPAYRGRQIAQWIYRRGARDAAEMTNLSKTLRAALAMETRVGTLDVAQISHSPDDTQKILFQLPDGLAVEGVLMRQDKRWTMCISSQAGCALRCAFCVTGTLGLRRNLTAGEIVDQVILGRRLLAELKPEAQLTNIVFMGMGEPLLNMDHLIRALGLLTSPQALAISPRRITVSTAGVTPALARLAAEGHGVNLAVSLNATTQRVRELLMPHAQRWPLDELLEALRAFPLTRQRRLTLEYVLLAGINDSLGDARRLARLARGLRCKINLIPYNESPGLAFERPAPETVDRFRDILLAEHFTVSVRHSKGRSIQAACGQLVGALNRRAA